MYYLLANNRIVKDVTVVTMSVFTYAYKHNKSLGEIKKQSENVYDLIEQNDLIKIKMIDTFSILEVCSINGGVNGMKHIIAIYKPNKKGDYIKVWEKKDE